MNMQMSDFGHFSLVNIRRSTKAARENVSHDNGPVTRPRESGGRGRRSPSAARWSNHRSRHFIIQFHTHLRGNFKFAAVFVPNNNTTQRNEKIPLNRVASIQSHGNVFERAHCRLICILIDPVRGWQCWIVKQFQWQIFSAFWNICPSSTNVQSALKEFTSFHVRAEGQSRNERLCFNQNSTDGPHTITVAL
jgi:hypothetical protein